MALQDTTTDSQATIWNPVSEKQFFESVKCIVAASSTNKAASFHEYEEYSGSKVVEGYLLDYHTEYHLSQDLAFIAAYNECPGSVSAASVTQDADVAGITFNIASNCGVIEDLRLDFESIAGHLEYCARKDITPEKCVDRIFHTVVSAAQSKIKDWLRCKRRVSARPRRNRGPLHRQMKMAVDKLRKVSDRTNKRSEYLFSEIDRFVDHVNAVMKHGSWTSMDGLKNILKSAGEMCGKFDNVTAYYKSLDIALETSGSIEETFGSFDLVANYWRLSNRLVNVVASERYRRSFSRISYSFVDYDSRRCIEGKFRIVHAEVQLATHHRQNKINKPPRIFGTSKAACYLCDLFLSHHKNYFVSATHGIIYDTWTIPDLREYSPTDRMELQMIINRMNDTMKGWAKKDLPKGLRALRQSAIFPSPTRSSSRGTEANLGLYEGLDTTSSRSLVESVHIITSHDSNKPQDIKINKMTSSKRRTSQIKQKGKQIHQSEPGSIQRRNRLRRKVALIKRKLSKTHETTHSVSWYKSIAKKRKCLLNGKKLGHRTILQSNQESSTSFSQKLITLVKKTIQLFCTWVQYGWQNARFPRSEHGIWPRVLSQTKRCLSTIQLNF